MLKSNVEMRYVFNADKDFIEKIIIFN